MAWISGRTISPTSGELVFTIDEDAQLPGPQVWEQLWDVCEGLEPIVHASGVGDPSEPVGTVHYTDSLDRAQLVEKSVENSEYTGEHLSITDSGAKAFDHVDPADIDPMSRCRSYIRKLTFRVLNFEISDNGDSTQTTQGYVGNNCATIGIYLRTRGKNPTKAALKGIFSDDISRAICWNESRWRHFLPNGKPLFNKNTNGTTDWGLMQVNEAPLAERWNWKANLNRGISLLAEKRNHAEIYLQKHPQGVTETMIENEMIQRYNGGAYHKWDANTETWQEQPPNGYVATIRSFMTSRPWEQ